MLLEGRGRVGRRSRRSRRGCLTCRQRHYKCDEILPSCSRCQRGKLICTWPDDGSAQNTISRSVTAELIDTRNLGDDRLFAYSLAPALATSEAEYLNFYLSNFHDYTFQICSWTHLLPLPKRSIIPDIMQSPGKTGTSRMTNWANFYLLHLAQATLDDPLSSAMAAYTALRMDAKMHAMMFYFRVLRYLRALLARKDASSIDKQEFLRIWSSVLLLSQYEQHAQNHHIGAYHLDGATTLCMIAQQKFPTLDANEELMMLPSTSTQEHSSQTPHLTSTVAQGELPRVPALEQESSSEQTDVSVPKNELELPHYLTEATKRFRYMSMAAEQLDIQWPRYRPESELPPLEALLEKAAEGLAWIMPLVQDFYLQRAKHLQEFGEDFSECPQRFVNQYLRARQSIAEYSAMLEELKGPEYAIRHEVAQRDFPFSPIIRFVNPQMAQPAMVPSVYLLFLAPFISSAEHEQALRHVSGIMAGRVTTPGLLIDSAYPDLFIAAFWKRGPQRRYFRQETSRRKGDFMLCLNKIWQAIDSIEEVERRPVDKTRILAIALEEYRGAMLEGFKLQHIPFWQTGGCLLEPWATIIGAPDVFTSAFASDAVKIRRLMWPDVSYYQERIRLFRECNVFNMAILKLVTLSGRLRRSMPAAPKPSTLYGNDGADFAAEEYKGPYTLEKFDGSTSSSLQTTAMGNIAIQMWSLDSEVDKLYFII